MDVNSPFDNLIIEDIVPFHKEAKAGEVFIAWHSAVRELSKRLAPIPKLANKTEGNFGAGLLGNVLLNVPEVILGRLGQPHGTHDP